MSFTTYEGARRLTDGSTEYHYVGYIHHRYRVFEEGWHNVDIQTCVDEDIYLRSNLKGEVHFKNPYGYVPAEQWGIIPFEVSEGIILKELDFIFMAFFRMQFIRAIVTTALAIGFGLLCFIHRVRSLQFISFFVFSEYSIVYISQFVLVGWSIAFTLSCLRYSCCMCRFCYPVGGCILHY